MSNKSLPVTSLDKFVLYHKQMDIKVIYLLKDGKKNDFNQSQC